MTKVCCLKQVKTPKVMYYGILPLKLCVAMLQNPLLVVLFLENTSVYSNFFKNTWTSFKDASTFGAFKYIWLDITWTRPYCLQCYFVSTIHSGGLFVCGLVFFFLYPAIGSDLCLSNGSPQSSYSCPFCLL